MGIWDTVTPRPSAERDLTAVARDAGANRRDHLPGLDVNAGNCAIALVQSPDRAGTKRLAAIVFRQPSPFRDVNARMSRFFSGEVIQIAPSAIQARDPTRRNVDQVRDRVHLWGRRGPACYRARPTIPTASGPAATPPSLSAGPTGTTPTILLSLCRPGRNCLSPDRHPCAPETGGEPGTGFLADVDADLDLIRSRVKAVQLAERTVRYPHGVVARDLPVRRAPEVEH